MQAPFLDIFELINFELLPLRWTPQQNVGPRFGFGAISLWIALSYPTNYQLISRLWKNNVLPLPSAHRENVSSVTFANRKEFGEDSAYLVSVVIFLMNGRLRKTRIQTSDLQIGWNEKNIKVTENMKQICEKHRPKQRAPLIEFIIMRAEVILLVILAVPIFCVYTPSLEPHHLRLVSRHAKKSEKSSKTDNVFRANRSSLGLLLHYRRPSTCPYVAHQNRRSPNNHHNLLLHWKSTPRALTFLGLCYWLNWAVWCALPFTLLSAAQCLPNATTIHHIPPQ